MIDIFFHFFNDLSAIIMTAMLIVTGLLGMVYLLDLGWNVVRATVDHEKGFRYYFSKKGPKN